LIAIIGYGNPLRSDDSIGQRLAEMMSSRMSGEAVQVTTAYQLTPELVEPISNAQLVVFIDARVGDTAGDMLTERVEPLTGTGAFTHNVSPGILLGAAHELYGAEPAGILVSIVGADFDYGSDLSPQLSQQLPDLANQVEAVIKANIRVAI